MKQFLEIGRTTACGARLALALLAWLPVAAFAGEAGHFQFVAGDVRVIDAAGAQRPAQKGQPVSEGETIVTTASGSAQLRMVDGGILALRPQSQLKIDTYVFNGTADGSENALLSLVKGGLRTITGLIGKTNKEKLTLQTPTAVIGVRGTDHEPMVVAEPDTADAKIAALAGTYDKVNVGATSLTTQAGTAVIAANQVGYAASPTTMPVILPKLPDFYRATPSPRIQQEQKQQGGTQAQGGQQSAQADSGSGSAGSGSSSSTSSSGAGSAQQASADSVTAAGGGGGDSSAVTTAPAAGNLTGVDANGNALSLAQQTLTTASGQTQSLSSSTASSLAAASGGSQVMLDFAYSQNAGGPAVPQSPTLGGPGLTLNRDSSGNLSNVSYSGSGNGISGLNFSGGSQGVQLSISPSGSSLTDTGSNAATGLSWGRWQGGQINESSQYLGQDASGNSGLGANNASGTFVIGGTSNQALPLGSASLHWIAGQIPTPSYLPQVLTGSAAYVLVGSTHPTDSSGNVGTLNSANLNVNFSQQTVNASVNFSFGSTNWIMQSSSMPLNGPQFFSNSNCSPTQCVSDVTVSKNGVSLGGTPTPGNPEGAFGNMGGFLSGTGLNGAALQYSLQDFGAGPNGASYNLIQGVAAFSGPTQDVNTPFRAVGTTDGWNALGDILGSGGTLPASYRGNVSGGEQPAPSVVDSASGLTSFVGQAAGYTAANSSIVVPQPSGSAQLDTINVGTATNTDLGSTTVGGITVSWGRWAGGTVNIYSLDGSTLLGTIDNSNRSIHWITTSSLGSNFSVMPQSGTATYTIAGNTSPTDFKGNVGTLNSATLNADFTNAKINAGINVSFNSATNTSTWNLTADNIPLSGADFKTNTSQNGANGIVNTVTCSGPSCGPLNLGYLEGHFIANAQGAALIYGMSTGTGASASSFNPTNLVTGLVVMKH